MSGCCRYILPPLRNPAHDAGTDSDSQREEKHLAQLPIFRISNRSDMKYEMNDTKWKVSFLHGADIGFEVQDALVTGHEIGHIVFPLNNVSNFPIHSLKVARYSLQTIGKTDFRRFEPVFDS